jgi:hypothetical protein
MPLPLIYRILTAGKPLPSHLSALHHIITLIASSEMRFSLPHLLSVPNSTSSPLLSGIFTVPHNLYLCVRIIMCKNNEQAGFDSHQLFLPLHYAGRQDCLALWLLFAF